MPCACVIFGEGPGGLQAVIFLGRYNRKTGEGAVAARDIKSRCWSCVYMEQADRVGVSGYGNMVASVQI